jgi:predicted transposase YbfD/YdcC
MITDPSILAFLDAERRWEHLQAIGMVRAERRIGQEITREPRYFLLSFTGVKTFAHAVRSHWASRIACIGCWIWLFEKMNHVFVRAMRKKIWLSFVM